MEKIKYLKLYFCFPFKSLLRDQSSCPLEKIRLFKITTLEKENFLWTFQIKSSLFDSLSPFTYIFLPTCTIISTLKHPVPWSINGDSSSICSVSFVLVAFGSCWETLWKLNQLLNTKADGVVPPGNAPWDLFPPLVHDSLVPKCRKGCSWNKRNGPNAESFFAVPCVLFGCTCSSSPSLASWQGAGTVRRVDFAGSLGVYQRSQNSIPYHKNDTGLQMTFGWNKAIRPNLLGPLGLPSLPRTGLTPSSFPSSECSAFGSLCVKSVFPCVWKSRLWARTVVFKVHFRMVVSHERCRQLLVGFYAPGDIISDLHLIFGKVHEK